MSVVDLEVALVPFGRRVLRDMVTEYIPEKMVSKPFRTLARRLATLLATFHFGSMERRP